MICKAQWGEIAKIQKEEEEKEKREEEEETLEVQRDDWDEADNIAISDSEEENLPPLTKNRDLSAASPPSRRIIEPLNLHPTTLSQPTRTSDRLGRENLLLNRSLPKSNINCNKDGLKQGRENTDQSPYRNKRPRI